MGDRVERPTRCFAFGPFVLIPERQLLLNDDVPVRIGSRALDILTALVERRGELVSKDDLLARVWPDTFVDEGNVKVNMTALRRALGEGAGSAQYIATVPGRGYRFVAPVQMSEPTGPASTSTAAAASSHDLPAATSQLLGRAEAVDAIQRDLNESRLVSIVGAGGIGKTTVAIAAARARVESATFIDFATISGSQFVPAAIASALGLGITSGDPFAGLVHALKSQQRLLLFDNCEHLLPATAAAADRLTRQLDGVRILATSREPLRVRGERVHRLRGLDCDPRERPTADEARAFPAVELFATRASERAGYQLTDADAPAAAEICRRLDGNALAIELAATHTAAFRPAAILQMLDDRFRVLRLGPPGAPLRQQSLLATLDWSYSLLSEREANLLRAISVFAGVFSVAGAAAVSNESSVDVVDTLAQLVAKSLLAMDTTGDVVIYRLLETTRAYGLERLQASGEDQEIRRRHAEHVRTVLDRATTEWAHRPAGEWGAAYGRVIDDLRGALTWAGGDAADRSLRIRLTLAGILLWNHFSLTEECRVHASQAVEDLDAAGLAGTASEMKLKLWLGFATMFTGGLKSQAMEALRRALDIAIRIGDTDSRLRCLINIGIYELFTGDHDAGIRTLETFASVAAAEDPSVLPEGEVHFGIAELFLGRLHNARQRLERLQQRDLRYFGSYGVRYLSDSLVLVGSVLSQVQWLTGSPDTAAHTAAVALELAHQSRHHLSLNNVLSYVCPIFYWSGDYEECGRYVAMLEDHVMRHGLVARRPVAVFYRAALACAQNDALSGSVEDLQRAVEEFRTINHLARMPYYLSVVAEAFVDHDRLDEATQTIRVALDIARAQNEGWCLPEVLRIQASILIAQGWTDEAEALLRRAMAIAQDVGALSWRLRAANDLAKLWRDLSRTDEAHRMLLPVYHEFTEGFATRDLIVAADLLSSFTAPEGM